MYSTGFYFSKVPFVRLVIPFMAGIIAGRFTGTIPFQYGLIILTVLFLFLFIFLQINKFRTGYRVAPVWAVVLYLALFTAGHTMYIQKQGRINDNFTVNQGMFTGTLAEPPAVKEKTIKATIDIEAINISEEWAKADGRVLVWFQKDKRTENLKAGDRIVFEPNLQEVKNMGNPNEFNYKQYLAFHLITHQTYLKSNRWVLLNTGGPGGILTASGRLRDYLLDIYRKYGLKNDIFSTVSAITLGYKNELDAEIKQSYSSAGAMHILAVSGLHVGVVYIVINSLLFFLNKKKPLIWLKTIFIILFLWGYALLTGLSPSVLRAATMFSFIVLGKAFGRYANIYNSMAASAFLLLLTNPLMLFDIGFQLSYLAVLGIVFFQPGIYNLLSLKNKITDKVWALSSVALAAQITTFPLSLYYFNQFPNYFLLTGLIVIPLSSVIIYSGILLFSVSAWDSAASAVAKFLEYTVSFMNSSIRFVENIPGSVTTGIHFSATQVILVYAAIILATFFVINKKILGLRLTLSTVILILALMLYDKTLMLNRKKIFVYNLSGISAVNFIEGRSNVLYSNIESSKQPDFKTLKGNWLSLGLKSEKIIPFSRLGGQFMFSAIIETDNCNIFFKKNFFGFHGKRMFYVRERLVLPEMPPTAAIKVDYLVLSDNAEIKLHEILQFVVPAYIIIDSSNSAWKSEKWQQEAAELGIPCFSVRLNGAFVVEV